MNKFVNKFLFWLITPKEEYKEYNQRRQVAIDRIKPLTPEQKKSEALNQAMDEISGGNDYSQIEFEDIGWGGAAPVRAAVLANQSKLDVLVWENVDDADKRDLFYFLEDTIKEYEGAINSTDPSKVATTIRAAIRKLKD